MKFVYRKLDDILVSTILPTHFKAKFQAVSFYEKKLHALCRNALTEEYFQETVMCNELDTKDVDNMLLGCCNFLDEDHDSFIKKLNSQTVQFITSLLWKYLPFPLTEVNRVPDIYNSPYRYLHGNTPEYVKAVKIFQLDFAMMSLTDYLAKLQAPDTFPYFNVNLKYKSLSLSVQSLDAWFAYQFKDQKEIVIKQIFDLINFKCGKKHCLWLCGESGSGKSFVLTSLATLFLNVGYIGNLEPKSDFCYSDVPNYKLIIMDEPTIPEHCFNDFKNFFAGQPVSCNIKHKKAEMSGKAFWILLSNDDDIFDISDPIWNSRIIKFDNLHALTEEFQILHSGEDHIYPLACSCFAFKLSSSL